MNTENKLQLYNGLWWMFHPEKRRWVVSDNEDIRIATLYWFHEDLLITECFILFKELQNEYEQRNK